MSRQLFARIIETILYDYEVEEMDEYNECEVWTIKGKIIEAFDILQKDEEVFLELNMQESHLLVRRASQPSICVSGKMNIMVSWNNNGRV